MTTTRRSVLQSGVAGLISLGVSQNRLASAAAADELATEFLHPPDTARPWVYWYFMDGNLTREGMTADLKAMKAAGIGGAIYLEVGLGIARGPVEFMSSAWQALLGDAFDQADQLGLEIALASGPGWCGTGGPWIKPEESMQHLVASETEVTGPTTFDVQLPRPLPRTPFFGEDTLSPELHKAWKDFYQDVVVLAFRTPAGNARLADIAEKAIYTRGSYSSQIPGPYSSRPWVRPTLPTAAHYATRPADESIASGEILDLTDKLTPDGRLRWSVPASNWTILRFGRTITGQTTRPSPRPGLGLETDKFSRTAIDVHFEAYIASLLQKTGKPRHAGRGLTTLHFDSWEMSSQNWSAKFREEFSRRRAYDLLRFLPAFSGYLVDNAEISERFLWDIRQTGQELVVENQGLRLRELGRRYGLQLALEPYDLNPASDLKLGSVADIPMGEFWSKAWEVPTDFSIVEATSAGHTQGRPVIAAEAFTATQAELWQQYPGSMKEQGDWAFCAGVNKFVFHRFQAQPWENRFPGMTMGPDGGYGVHWDRTQTWWSMAPTYHSYLGRCQQLLRRGLFVADILYLAPEGAPCVFLPPPSALTPGKFPDRLGYNFDGCAPETLIARASVKQGRIVFPDGMTYSLLVLPQLQTMTPPLLQKITRLVEDGATVVGAPPQKSPSLTNHPACDREVQMLAAKLWGAGGIIAQRNVGKGRIILDTEAAQPNPANPLLDAKWIWSAGDTPTVSSPPEGCYLSRSFIVQDAATVGSAEVAITASPGFELYINGKVAAAESNSRQVKRVDVTTLLRSGENLLLVNVTATNAKKKSPAPGLIASLTIRCLDGKTTALATGRDWKTSQTAHVASANAKELGAFSASPWSLNEASIQDPNLYPSYRAVAKVLEQAGTLPDFQSDAGIRYIHRRDGGADLYFIANKEGRAVSATCRFRVTGRQPEWWNPLTGELRHLPQFTQHNAHISIPFRLHPFESGFVVFRKPFEKAANAGDNFPEPQTVITLNAPWHVSFDPKWGGPAKIVFRQLDDWSKRSESGIKYYSGKAVYHSTFDFKDLPQSTKKNYFLSLGVVKNLAAVKLNGRDLGVVWCHPWRLALPAGVLQKRDNQLEITVANLWINRLIGDSALPQEQRLTWLTGGNPFRPESSLQESGLLGPVTLQSMA